MSSKGKAFSGAMLVLLGVVRLLSDKDVTVMDQVLNVTFFIGLCVGVGLLTKGLYEETRK